MISRLSGILLTLVVSQGFCFVPSPLRNAAAPRGVMRMATENELPEEVTRVRISSPRGDESLPTNYARSFPHWVAHGGDLTRIPKPDSDEGFVEPSSFSEVWLPVDLPSPEARLGLCFVLKDGAPRYILPALDLYVREEGDPPGPAWRNRGLNSVAMARAWLPFDIDVLEFATLSVLQCDASATRVDDLPAWSVTLDRAPIREAVEAMVAVLASGPPQLAAGFLYLTVAMDVKLPAPSAGGRCRVYLSPRAASDLLSVGTRVDCESGLLDVRWVEVAAGGESEFLPPAYRPLYRVL